MNILVFGHPHCGTTILRTIIGRCDGVVEITTETPIVPAKTLGEIAVTKWPYCEDRILNGNAWKNYKKVMILRNPLYTFSSLNRRFGRNKNSSHDYFAFRRAAEVFHQKKDGLITIRYEDIFTDGYSKLRSLLDELGLSYTDRVLLPNGNGRNNFGGPVPRHKPKMREHSAYRTWQVNQPLIYADDVEKLSLFPEQIRRIREDTLICELWPEIPEILSYYHLTR